MRNRWDPVIGVVGVVVGFLFIFPPVKASELEPWLRNSLGALIFFMGVLLIFIWAKSPKNPPTR